MTEKTKTTQVETQTEQTAPVVRTCPDCGAVLDDPCDPDFCEACFQDFPMHSACIEQWDW